MIRSVVVEDLGASSRGSKSTGRWAGVIRDGAGEAYRTGPPTTADAARRLGVAEPGTAPGSGPGERGIEALLPDHRARALVSCRHDVAISAGRAEVSREVWERLGPFAPRDLRVHPEDATGLFH